MIVYTFAPAWNSVDISPFCVKLLTWLRMAQLPYKTDVGDIRKMPKGKLPAIELDGKMVGDSGLIIEALQTRFNDPLGDAARTSQELATARALRSMLENEMYFVTLYFRWADEGNFQIYLPRLVEYARNAIPGWLAPWLIKAGRRKVIRQLYLQGMGRHTPDEIAALGIECLIAVSDYLADKPFMLGDQPSTLDATVFAYLNTLLETPFRSPVKDFAHGRANLVNYHNRMLARWWPELSGRTQTN